MNTENNKIIAEFMGIADEIETGATSLIQIEGITGYYKNDDLKYHSDWNWLMEAIEKCREMQIFGSQRLIDNIDNRLLKLDLLATYKNVVDFISWYNEQK